MLSRIDWRIRVCFCSASCDARQLLRALLGGGASLGDALLERRVEHLQLFLRAQPLADLLLQLASSRLQIFVRALQRRIALLNLQQHHVEAIDQRTDLIVLRLLCAQGKVLLRRDRPHRPLEIENRSRDDRLQPR